MFTYKLNPNSRTTLYDQLFEAIAESICDGKIAKGEKLPSRRELSEHLSVSPQTVSSAYNRLIEEGYCESRPKSGIYSIWDGTQKKHFPQTAPEIRYDFRTGAVDAARFPYHTWAKLMRTVLSEQKASLLLSCGPKGLLALRQEIAKLLYRERGMVVNPEHVVIGSGTDQLVGAVLGLIGRDRPFAVEDPGYARVRRGLSIHGARLAPLPLRDGAIDIRMLYTSGAGAAYVTPTHQFPTGSRMLPEQRAALRAWAKETRAWILEDDYECEFTGDGEVPLYAEEQDSRVIYMNTFTRTLAPGLRISFMVLPETLAAQYESLGSASPVTGFEQETLCKFIAGGHFERHIHAMRTLYRNRRSAMEKGITELGLGEIQEANNGLFLSVLASGTVQADQLVSCAQQKGVQVSRMVDFCLVNSEGYNERIVLLSFSSMEEKEIREGLRLLKEAWKV